MTLTLLRKNKTEHYTEGELFQGEKKLCDTLEDKVRVIRNRQDKVIGYTAIPEGTYNVAWTYSPKFHRNMPLIEQVPWFSGIRIHSGNTAEDTSGCVLVGQKDGAGRLTMSKVTAERIFLLISSAVMRKEKVTIIVQ